MITWQNATEGTTEIETGEYVTINGVNYPVKTKMSSATPLSAENMNTNQANLVDFIQQNDGSYLPADNKQISMSGISGLNEKLSTMQECFCIGLSSAVTYTSAHTIEFNSTVFSNTNKLSLQSNGVKIGAGVHHVMVSANVFAQRNNTQGNYLWTRIEQNGTAVSIAIADYTGDYCSSVHTDMPLTVNEGDIITCYVITNNNNTLRAAPNTYMTVKIID